MTMESVILSSPLLVVLYLISFALNVFSAMKRTGFSVTAVAILLFVGSTAYALIEGASLYEAGAVAALFFAFRLIAQTGEK